ncbi:LapA family protein [Nocardia amikacinitolerans]|uniref:LapA family protein n=1 Tax=Nocardia amikacinitolerans TaxID=756689 RepID=UPI000831D898|nr:lipopolysaccharide assembly protein LapA domain-containing protein [Nocardia amikacinitolerans]
MSTNAEHEPEASRRDKPTVPPTTPPPAPPATRPPMTGAKPSISSRTGYAWVGLVVGTLIMILLLIFILQNLQTVEVSMFFWNFHLPLGVAVLLSVISGALVMALVGGMRILQLRRAAKH